LEKPTTKAYPLAATSIGRDSLNNSCIKGEMKINGKRIKGDTWFSVGVAITNMNNKAK
jgi:hypothetical protein